MNNHHLVSIAFLLIIVNFVEPSSDSLGRATLDPIHGFKELPFNRSYYVFHKPYNLPLNERYSFKNGVHRLWVYTTDKPLYKGSPTRPRTEIMVNGYKYSSGVMQFEGHGFVPKGTTGVCIMQVFGSDPPHATTSMLRVYNGSLTYYRTPIVPNLYGRWFRLNVIHDVESSKVEVYVDGVRKYEASGHGGARHYFKFGVYAQDFSSDRMESRWRGIKILKKL
ncbi:hypothetical protein K2173_005182 [Erythroxylum novogranatense]|uniref:Alginate lyase 2 domain-containing protein n=1 Tax=Erythroxylum novogranatense TaxID=1862640 RepID=A0AAV8TU21_9ROSI|nr:hypothetical protein K2173_005182 [Erythroxylum novogranatense]